VTVFPASSFATFFIDFLPPFLYLFNPRGLGSFQPSIRNSEMYAVVEIAGKQYKVTNNDEILVPTRKEKPGDKVKFDRVLLLGSDKEIMVGHPVVTGASVEATIMDGVVRGEKVIVFKKKKRKGYRVKKGHRQDYTRVQITNIVQ
jgi:large subunit ribosomal protein L21